MYVDLAEWKMVPIYAWDLYLPFLRENFNQGECPYADVCGRQRTGTPDRLWHRMQTFGSADQRAVGVDQDIGERLQEKISLKTIIHRVISKFPLLIA